MHREAGGQSETLDQHRRQDGQQQAQAYGHDGVQDPFAGRQPAAAVLDQEVLERDDQLGREQQSQQDRQGAVPAQPGQRQEDHGVDGFAQGVEGQFLAGGGAGRQLGCQFVVPQGVGGAEQALGDEDDEDDFHQGTSGSAKTPS